MVSTEDSKKTQHWRVLFPRAGLSLPIFVAFCFLLGPNIHTGEIGLFSFFGIMLSVWILAPVWLLVNAFRLVQKRRELSTRDYFAFSFVLGSLALFWLLNERGLLD